MKRSIALLTVLSFLTFSIHAQEIHSPAEIFKILEKSEVSYEMGILEETIPAPDRSSNVITNDYYQKKSEDGIEIKRYNIGKGTAKILADAEKSFIEGKYENALKSYEEAYNSDKTYYKLITYMGQMHGTLKRWDKAEEMYKLAIEKNYIDYMAHWFLADLYLDSKRKKEALREITIAQVLNRNNPRLKSSFDIIYKANKLKTPNWVFNPQYKMDSIAPKKVKLEVNEDWMAYALPKALWKYEPGYSESMGQPDGSYTILEERESLIGLIVLLDKKKKKKKMAPAMKVLEKSLDEKFITEYILYEIMLPQYPMLASQLPKELLERTADYVLKMRGEKKK